MSKYIIVVRKCGNNVGYVRSLTPGKGKGFSKTDSTSAAKDFGSLAGVQSGIDECMRYCTDSQYSFWYIIA